jgi:hypothetical protein
MQIVEHDPEKYANENYGLALRNLREGTGFKKRECTGWVGV